MYSNVISDYMCFLPILILAKRTKPKHQIASIFGHLLCSSSTRGGQIGKPFPLWPLRLSPYGKTHDTIECKYKYICPTKIVNIRM